MNTFYAVLNITKWDEVDATVMGRTFPVTIPETGIGFIPVYDDLEKAKKDYPNGRILELTRDNA
jgi:hypothetical protein